MGKISIATLDAAPRVEPPGGFAGDAEVRALFDGDQDPIHGHVHRLARGGRLRIGPLPTDCVAYVWQGAVQAGGRRLDASSSLIVEHGASADIEGAAESPLLVVFRASRPSANIRAGGHVHLLPAAHAPRAELAGTPGVSGALHADAGCPTCEVWLHENSLPPMPEQPTASERAVHSHSEDEVIFVIGGEMRLGTRPYGPGSAIAIPAETFYSFGVGPEGLQFINFRPALPDVIKFKCGEPMDEVGYWRNGVGVPQYLDPLPA